MFWRDRDRERDNKDQNGGGGPPCGQVRVLVVGDSGVGKTALVHLMVKGSSITRPPQTVGCTVGVKHTTYGNSGSSSSSIKGVIFVHDLSQRRTKTGLQKWAAEIAATGTFSAPLGSGGPGGLPVPYIVIGNKADIAEEGTRGSSGNLVDVARQWVEKQGLLPSSEELPLTEGFPGAGGLIAAAKEARYDKEAVMKFFRTLIKRRYFSDDLPAQNPWSSSPVQRPAQTVDENWSDEDHSYRNASLRADPYKYNMLPPLPAQRNLTPPPTLYPQQPVSVSENYRLPRFSHNSYSEISSAARSKRSDINVERSELLVEGSFIVSYKKQLMDETKNEEAVCVTGANGFIGSWLVKTLLEEGYTRIHASIFPASDPSHLFSLPGADRHTITVFEADLLDADAVARAVQHCQGVFHVASPCTLDDPTDPQAELVLPAVQGTLNVLQAASKFGVRRVVLTSSISAMVPNPSWPPHKPFDESSWTDLDYCKARQAKWYPVSKTEAEKAAWEFAEKHGLDVVAIHPATCLGPLLQPSLNASSAVLLNLLLGSNDTQEHHWLGAVHVQDVVKAQVLLFESRAASGRYLCTNGIFQFANFALTVSKLFPHFPIHRFSGETQPGLKECKDAAKRLIELGLVFKPVEDAVQDTVESLKAKGFLKPEISPSNSK
ncbi:hypothetical protein ACFX13_045404 [Malus domestica]